MENKNDKSVKLPFGIALLLGSLSAAEAADLSHINPASENTIQYCQSAEGYVEEGCRKLLNDLDLFEYEIQNVDDQTIFSRPAPTS